MRTTVLEMKTPKAFTEVLLKELSNALEMRENKMLYE